MSRALAQARQSDQASVVARVHALIDEHGLTLADLGATSLVSRHVAEASQPLLGAKLLQSIATRLQVRIPVKATTSSGESDKSAPGLIFKKLIDLWISSSAGITFSCIYSHVGVISVLVQKLPPSLKH